MRDPRNRERLRHVAVLLGAASFMGLALVIVLATAYMLGPSLPR